jgi:hypothetical protein
LPVNPRVLVAPEITAGGLIGTVEVTGASVDVTGEITGATAAETVEVTGARGDVETADPNGDVTDPAKVG